ncbi:hypothetical protein [Alicycliphilus denitrificans]|uniref:hypothetical protein n=1 Tax=Alicycliphilus denitrificans TaxID=179636 RepID=UPI003A7F907A
MHIHRFTLLAPAAALLFAAAAQSATSVHDQYRADRAACAGEPAESRAACIREAGAAAQAARQGGLSSSDASTYENNALARCDAFKTPEDKSDCIARMGSKATVQGSVDGGGLLRESVRTYTVEP